MAKRLRIRTKGANTRFDNALEVTTLNTHPPLVRVTIPTRMSSKVTADNALAVEELLLEMHSKLEDLLG